MARLSLEQWAEVRKDREENGTPYRALAAKYGVSDAAIIKRAKAEEWGGKGSSAGKRSTKSKQVSKKVSANHKANPRANRKRKPAPPVEELEELPEELKDKAVPLEDADSIEWEEGDEEGDAVYHNATLTRVRTRSLEEDLGEGSLVEVYGTSRGNSKYHPAFADLAYKHCLLGATPKHVADLLQVDEVTIYRWMETHPSFGAAMEQGRGDADANVARSLYKKATGYTHQAVKVFQYQGEPVVVPYTEVVAPDTDAAKFWLKNRQPELWKDKVEVEEKPTLALVDEEKMGRIYREALEHAAQVEREMQGRADRLGLVIDHDEMDVGGGDA